MPGEPDRQCGIDYQLRSYIARQANDKPEKKRVVSLTIKKLTHAPAGSMPNRPTLDVKKEYILSSNPIHVEANLDRAVYYHGESIVINVSITNSSSRQVFYRDLFIIIQRNIYTLRNVFNSIRLCGY